MDNYLLNILQLFKNVTLNSDGVKRQLLQHLQAKKVNEAISLMTSHYEEVDNAISEYNPQTHRVMFRENKNRNDGTTYFTEKLPRSRQKYINEVELFFLLGENIIWTQDGGTPEAFAAFKQFLTDTHFNARTRTAKRLAGAETECAKLYNIYKRNGETQINSVILARSTGYDIRTLFDAYGNLIAFAYGYKQKEDGGMVQHWDIQLAELLFFTKQTATGFEVNTLPNPTGKINVIYARQPKAWEGVEQRLHREEMLDSKIGDTNNYYADPIACATADVIENIVDPDKPGKLIQLNGPNSSFSYINPPQQSELRRAEKEDLVKSILFDTFTPDLSFENLRGMGTLSGAAIRNSFILGYMKRTRNIEIWEELIQRDKNLILAMLPILYPTVSFADFDVSFEFAEPFSQDKMQNWAMVAQLYRAGLMSLDTALDQIDIAKDKDAEMDRIAMGVQSQEEQQEEPTEGQPNEPQEGEGTVEEDEVNGEEITK